MFFTTGISRSLVNASTSSTDLHARQRQVNNGAIDSQREIGVESVGCSVGQVKVFVYKDTRSHYW